MTATVSARRQRRGTFANGMEYLTLGDGPKSMLFIQGGPGSVLPSGPVGWLRQRRFVPYVRAGYAVSIVTRRRHMPAGHTVADMAQDYADVIRDEFGGRVDVVVGESFGGMIAQYLAALHPERLGAAVFVVAGCRVDDDAGDVDSRLVSAWVRGDRRKAGEVFGEYLAPGPRFRWLRRLVGPLLLPQMMGAGTPDEDLLTENAAEVAFDSRDVLPRISVPVLLVAGDRDRFFPEAVIKETARLIPEHTVVWYHGKGHMRVGASREVAGDVLRFLS